MRTPQINPSTLLVACLAGALGSLLGGTGGLWVKLRALRVRLDGHDDELEKQSKRISAREGTAGRQRQLEQSGKLTAEIEQIVAAAKAPSLPATPVPRGSKDQELMAWCDSIFGPRGGKRDAEQ